MLLHRRFLFLLCLLMVTSLLQAQTRWPSTLLWKVTGNGLQKPSYLFGTMHLQDKRLFDFSDSLYAFLERADGYAMEINIQEYIDTLMMRTIARRQQELLSEEEDQIVDSRKIAKGADTLLRQLGLDRKKLTARQLRKVRDYRVSRMVAQGEMPTIVDAYLYGLALRQGKWTGGIEDVADQIDLRDELGKNIDPDEVFAPEQNLRLSLEKMVQIYLAQDLQKISDASYADHRDPFTQSVLIQRNVKMARRMDSMARERSMFFAVGAAHLPSDSGVIALLRSRGFRVEPVHSATKTPAAGYAAKLNSLNWIRVEGEERLFSIEMPGKASSLNVFGEVVRMNLCFDITTMTFYMAGSTLSEAENASDLDAMVANFTGKGSQAARVLLKKDISTKGTNGKEVWFSNGEGEYRIRLLQKGRVLYLLMAGSNKRSNLSGSDVDRYFRSFTPLEAVAKPWTVFALPEKGVSVSLPGTPKKNTLLEESAKGSNWKFAVYDFMDLSSGLYFVFQVRDLQPGYSLGADSAYFEEFREMMTGKFEKTLRQERTQYQGYPAFRFWCSDDKVRFKTLNIVRGNRVYVLMVALTEKSDEAAADRYFNSLQLTPYPSVAWKEQVSAEGGFRALAPSPFVEDKEDGKGEGPFSRRQFTAFDSVQVVSCDVVKTALGDFYWAQEDSSFFRGRLSGYYSKEGDTVLLDRPVTSGEMRGWEMWVQPRSGGNVKKFRMLISRDTLYELITSVPGYGPPISGMDRFFHDFQPARAGAPAVFTPKLPALLAALRSEEEAVRERAGEVLSEVTFTPADLPLLRQALTVRYGDEEEGRSDIHSKLVDILVELDDADSLSAFTGQAYRKLGTANEILKYPLLRLLALQDSDSSFEWMARLLGEGFPRAGSPEMLTWPLLQSPERTAGLFPLLIRGSQDSLMRELVVEVAVMLDRSGRLDTAVLMPHRASYLQAVRDKLNALKANPDEWWEAESWIRFAGLFRHPDSYSLLRSFLASFEENRVKLWAALQLIRSGQQVDAALINRLAGDRESRVSLYTGLQEMKQQSLFPAAWGTQQRLAESELYDIAAEETMVGEIRFLGQRLATYEGKKQKFLLFYIGLEDEGDGGYLGIAGPYAPEAKKVVLGAPATDVYWGEAFDKTKVDALFRAYLKTLEE